MSNFNYLHVQYSIVIYFYGITQHNENGGTAYIWYIYISSLWNSRFNLISDVWYSVRPWFNCKIKWIFLNQLSTEGPNEFALGSSDHVVFRDIIWSILIRITRYCLHLFWYSVLGINWKEWVMGRAFDPSAPRWFGKITIKFHRTSNTSIDSSVRLIW